MEQAKGRSVHFFLCSFTRQQVQVLIRFYDRIHLDIASNNADVTSLGLPYLSILLDPPPSGRAGGFFHFLLPLQEIKKVHEGHSLVIPYSYHLILTSSSSSITCFPNDSLP